MMNENRKKKHKKISSHSGFRFQTCITFSDSMKDGISNVSLFEFQGRFEMKKR